MSRIDDIAKVCDKLVEAATSSEAVANEAYDALVGAVLAHKAADLRILNAFRDARLAALRQQSTLLQNAVSQMQDGVALSERAVGKGDPNLLAAALRSLSVLSRIPARDLAGPCETSVLSLLVDTSALMDALPLCSELIQVCGSICRARFTELISLPLTPVVFRPPMEPRRKFTQ